MTETDIERNNIAKFSSFIIQQYKFTVTFHYYFLIYPFYKGCIVSSYYRFALSTLIQ